MKDSCGEGDDGSEQRKLKSPGDLSQADHSRRVTGRPVIIYTDSPKPIHVEAQDFKDVVQRLTGKSGKRSTKNYGMEHSSAAQLPQSSESSCKSQEASECSTVPQQSQDALEEYLDRLDRETPAPQPTSNLGFFPTAGLVKGVNVELGLQWRNVPDAAGASSSRPSESLNLKDLEFKDNLDGD